MRAILQAAMKDAMRAKEARKLQTIRAILSAIQYAEMQGDELTNEQILVLLKSELKKREEEREYAEKAERLEQLKDVDEEIAVIKSFLPRALNEGEIKDFVGDYLKAGGLTKLSEIMKALNAAHPGSIDGKMASQVIRTEIGG